MTGLRTRRIATLDGEIETCRARLLWMREELAARERALDDSRLRLLIAETPIADGDVRIAARGRADAADAVSGLEARLLALGLERARLEQAAPPLHA